MTDEGMYISYRGSWTPVEFMLAASAGLPGRVDPAKPPRLPNSVVLEATVMFGIPGRPARHWASSRSRFSRLLTSLCKSR